MTFVGDQKIALERLNEAIPIDLLAYRFLTGADVTNLLMGRFEEVVRLGEEARQKTHKMGAPRLSPAKHQMP